MATRELHAIEIKLKSGDCLSVVVWPFEDREVCMRLINSNRTWLTARAGDAVLLKRDSPTEWQRFFIESVSLYRAFPVEFNGTVLETAQTWLEARCS
jgi:hypothetical protein